MRDSAERHARRLHEQQLFQRAVGEQFHNHHRYGGVPEYGAEHEYQHQHHSYDGEQHADAGKLSARQSHLGSRHLRARVVGGLRIPEGGPAP